MVDLLLVEDDESSRLAIVEYLSANGVEVRAVSGGHEAIVAARRYRPRMLLCDWLLPDGLRGVEVARALLGANPELAIVFVTGLPVETIRDEVGDLPVRAMLSKPVSLDHIHSAVSAALDDPGLPDVG